MIAKFNSKTHLQKKFFVFLSHCKQSLQLHLVHYLIQVMDPDSVNQDPDPAFQVNPDPVRIQGFYDQKLKKKY
jgi:hypothetical protein